MHSLTLISFLKLTTLNGNRKDTHVGMKFIWHLHFHLNRPASLLLFEQLEIFSKMRKGNKDLLTANKFTGTNSKVTHVNLLGCMDKKGYHYDTSLLFFIIVM